MYIYIWKAGTSPGAHGCPPDVRSRAGRRRHGAHPDAQGGSGREQPRGGQSCGRRAVLCCSPPGCPGVGVLRVGLGVWVALVNYRPRPCLVGYRNGGVLSYSSSQCQIWWWICLVFADWCYSSSVSPFFFCRRSLCLLTEFPSCSIKWDAVLAHT